MWQFSPWLPNHEDLPVPIWQKRYYLIKQIAKNQYSPRKAAYDLKKFRGKNIIRKIENSRRSQPTPEGIKTITALLVIREKIIKPVVARATKPKRGPQPKNPPPINVNYQNLQSEMPKLFHTMGIAA